MVLSKSIKFTNKIVKTFRNYSTKIPGLLSDVNVLDLTRVIAGPFCSMTLGDLGANVIKVESLEGDEARKWGPPFIPGSTDSFYFMSVNRNKKSVCVDLKSQEGKFGLDIVRARQTGNIIICLGAFITQTHQPFEVQC